MKPDSLRESIAAFSVKLGFGAVGFATASPCSMQALFEQWLASGSAAGMDFLARHATLRQDPRQIAGGTRTVIVVAARYATNPQPGRGFSWVARGEDYHAVIRRRLADLSSFIRSQTPLNTARICVDSAPLAEREWAIRAGIGWRGRQGQIISPTLGACMVLGFLLVDIELAPSAQVPNQCGDCRKCLTTCPTGALQADGLVNAQRCLSYLTIEHKGEIAEALKKQMSTVLFGCDLCTAVCPWNAYGEDRVLPELKPRSMPTAAEILHLNDAEFEARFRDSSVHRTGLERLQRNARIALAAGAADSSPA